jgi:hypothetical protein
MMFGCRAAALVGAAIAQLITTAKSKSGTG